MNKKLKFKPYIGLSIVCNKCKKTIHNDFTPHKNGCQHPIEKQVYKAKIHLGNGRRPITRNLKSKDYDDAIIELIELKKNSNSFN